MRFLTKLEIFKQHVELSSWEPTESGESSIEVAERLIAAGFNTTDIERINNGDDVIADRILEVIYDG